MTPELPVIPVALFAYARPDHLARTLAGLRANQVPLIYAFCDGARDAGVAERVSAVRRVIRSVDWCDIRIEERPANLGLGVSIRTGVARVLEAHEMLLVVEDDLVLIPGAYAYLAAALRQYRAEPRVMSVSAWAHDAIRPPGPPDLPFFDGRFECWGWGTWRRAWQGMEMSAADMMRECRRNRIDLYRYGTDVAAMAGHETRLNLWAARFGILHLLRGGLCLHPPWALAENIGFGQGATNTRDAGPLEQAVAARAPELPASWPPPVEHPSSPKLWQVVCGANVGLATRLRWRVSRTVRTFFRRRTS